MFIIIYGEICFDLLGLQACFWKELCSQTKISLYLTSIQKFHETSNLTWEISLLLKDQQTA